MEKVNYCDKCGREMDNDFSNYCDKCRDEYQGRVAAETERCITENFSIRLGR
jgi:hypothetical protein